MSDRKASVIFFFFFVIPYLAAQFMIGIAYNALVLHASSVWRTLIGAGVGAVILYFAKIPVERPLRILGKYTYVPLIHLAVRFFMLASARPLKITLNLLLDFGVAVGSTNLVRFIWPDYFGYRMLIGTPFGWCLAVMFISIMIGAYLDFETMSIVNPKLVNPELRQGK
ncbi:hypothetical protein [Lacticaseibacillus nasuensis]|uniref:Uncharacterized protein n=1 Tax=Lacticaseibacillus nasuensis JCM 17158 TaxID=1291734 RepID=A0A0R1JS68_9LACO|nr:hypothetical protein [Lacticaseibacillus nasuensis]KRK74160.1 hypothetical protein FD02_GL000755 [Lacticaseibacillus nasuensis JCM 17158]